MKNKKLIRNLIVSASVILTAALIVLFIQPTKISINEESSLAESYKLSLNATWSHPPEPVRNNDNPIGFVSVDNTYVNSDGCVIEILSTAIDADNAYKNDSEASFALAFPDGVPVLKSLSGNALFSVPASNENKLIEMIKSDSKANSMSYFIDYKHSNVLTLNRISVKSKSLIQIVIACPEGSNVKPADFIKDIKIESVKQK